MIKSFKTYRLIEEGETLEEYKERRKAIEYIDKVIRPEQRNIWRSNIVGPYVKKDVEEALKRLEDKKKEDEITAASKRVQELAFGKGSDKEEE